MRDKLRNYCQIQKDHFMTEFTKKKVHTLSKKANRVTATGSGFENGWLSWRIPGCNFKCHFQHQLSRENEANNSSLCVLTIRLAFLIGLS